MNLKIIFSLVLLFIFRNTYAQDSAKDCSNLVRIAQLMVENNDALIDPLKPKPILAHNTILRMPINEEAVYAPQHYISYLGEEFFYLIDREGIIVGNLGTLPMSEASLLATDISSKIAECLKAQGMQYQHIGDEQFNYYVITMPNDKDVVIGIVLTENDSSKDVTVMIMSGGMLSKLLGN